MTKLIKCDCTNTYQDKRYGGLRVANQTKGGWRCTVCKRNHF